MQHGQSLASSNYSLVLDEIRRLVDAEPDRGTPDGDRLEALTILAEELDAEAHGFDAEDVAAR